MDYNSHRLSRVASRRHRWADSVLQTFAIGPTWCCRDLWVLRNPVWDPDSCRVDLCWWPDAAAVTEQTGHCTSLSWSFWFPPCWISTSSQQRWVKWFLECVIVRDLTRCWNHRLVQTAETGLACRPCCIVRISIESPSDYDDLKIDLGSHADASGTWSGFYIG